MRPFLLTSLCLGRLAFKLIGRLGVCGGVQRRSRSGQLESADPDGSLYMRVRFLQESRLDLSRFGLESEILPNWLSPRSKK